MTRVSTIFFALFALTLSAQTTCDTIYDFPETMPQYVNDVKGLSNYVIQKLSPIISDCIKQDGEIIASLYLVLTIDAQGNVVYVDFPKHQTSHTCENKLRQEIITMSGWTSGKIGNQAVCSRFNWPISCLKWE